MEKGVPSATENVNSETACDAILKALPDCIRAESPQFSELKFKALNRRGDALLLLGRAEDAVADYNGALELRPKDAYALLNRGNAYVALGKPAEAPSLEPAPTIPRPI